MPETHWLDGTTPAFRLTIATSWLAPEAWAEKQQQAIREAVAASPDWNEYLRLIDRHRTPALSWAALKRVPGLEIPEDARHPLKMRSDACHMEAVRQSMLLAEVLKGFGREQIPAMPFKGQVLSQLLYGDPGLRHSRDLDVAVTKEDLPRAQACLEKMGWRRTPLWIPTTPGQRESFLRYEHHLDYFHSQSGFMLELHWRDEWETADRNAARMARSSSALWMGATYRVLDPSDLALYLASHGGHHLWFRAKWLGDLARLRTANLVDWNAAFAEAERTRQQEILLAALLLLDRVYALPLPDLPGDPWTGVAPMLIDMPLQALKEYGEPEPNSTISLTSFRTKYRISRYDKLLRRRRTWKETLGKLAYCRDDHDALRLSDGLAWAYLPLRPVLWASRFLTQSLRRIAGASKARAA